MQVALLYRTTKESESDTCTCCALVGAELYTGVEISNLCRADAVNVAALEVTVAKYEELGAILSSVNGLILSYASGAWSGGCC